MMAMMPWTYLVIVLGLILYLGTMIHCALSRKRHGVIAPAVTGPAPFERALRIQQNTLEQLVVFVPAVWIFGLIVNPLWGAIIGIVWIAGRLIYALSYARNPAARGPGFLISFLVLVVLVLADLAQLLVWLATRLG